MKNNGNMPAMPQTVNDGYGRPIALMGLSKREYFAALAMAGLAANPSVMQGDIPDEAVTIADALLNQLQATEDGE